MFTFKFHNFADALIQHDLQMRTEAIKPTNHIVNIKILSILQIVILVVFS